MEWISMYEPGQVLAKIMVMVGTEDWNLKLMFATPCVRVFA